MKTKYRAWDSKLRKMFDWDWFIGRECDWLIEGDDWHVMQYTGECEFHRTDIYGGDVLAFTVFDMNDSDTQHKGIVKFCDGEWQLWNPETEDGVYGSDGPYPLHWTLFQDVEAVVIGNIHQNPELRETKNV